MKTIKWLISVLLFAVTLVLSSCGKVSETQTAAGSAENPAAKTTEASQDALPGDHSREDSSSAEVSAAEETVSEAESSSPILREPAVIRVGFFETPVNDGLWERLKEPLAARNIELEIFHAPVGTPILSTFSDESLHIDLCIGYSMESLSEGMLTSEYADKICPVGYTYLEPMNLYAWDHQSLADLPDHAVIALPNRQLARALSILESAGLITVKDTGTVLETTDLQNQEKLQAYIAERIAENPKNLTFETYDLYFFDQFAVTLNDGIDAAVLNKRHADQYRERILKELFEDPLTYEPAIPVILAHTEDTKDPEKLDLIEIVVETYQSQITADYLSSIRLISKPAGWDIDLIAQYR